MRSVETLRGDEEECSSPGLGVFRYLCVSNTYSITRSIVGKQTPIVAWLWLN